MQAVERPPSMVPTHPPHLPFLPGTSFSDPRKTHHPKTQTLVYCTDSRADNIKAENIALDEEVLQSMNSTAAWRIDTSRPVITHDERRAAKDALRNTYRPTIQPAWLKHDRQVLRFFCFYQEPVVERPDENFRVRNCVLNYHLEDGTVQMNEPKVENSGIPQGPFLKRHRARKPDGTGDLLPGDIKLGMKLELYGKVFRVADCDDFTKWFYQQAGFELGTPVETRTDNFFDNSVIKRSTLGAKKLIPKEVAEQKEYTEVMLGGARKNLRLQQFLDNDRRVLRFYCYWDDLARYGARVYYVLHYFLSDDTVEILEQHPRNSGRDPFPVFLRRQKLTKNPEVKACPGLMENAPKPYRTHDMMVGGEISVYNRRFHLYDCDDFTRQFYKDYLNITQPRDDIPKEVADLPKLDDPPHIGLGSDEDSLATCKHLVPRPLKVDMQKLLTMSDKMLRFEGRVVNGQKEDERRRFIIGMRLSDEAMGVWELRCRNSGHTEGKFAELGRKKNPMAPAGPRPSFYKPEDLFVGATIFVSATPFYLIRADEYTLKYMETHPAQFPLAGVDNVLARLKPVLQQLQADGVRTVTPEELKSKVVEALGEDGALIEHELITLIRHPSALPPDSALEAPDAPLKLNIDALLPPQTQTDAANQ
ncbi:unnamed protein product [Vitrella brassicaformis CCMP3155]|uniref:DM10 domain-containing protein n=3 Tax=Vitrella brassicaformis TaxID=1169539 RepID=A0A0G4E8Q6_VITBC|nr:unnamed protein product [Vitrella brassicaformis CCMP3155]|mmetsp:Transcript_6335/g.15272  ORF Transcript_6335/g.15272 Transcript_6335/m.15272 type:complete len:646 (+) Transcript_6335:151-2088(+)|eukprot:CEL92256.1 unnamed protein product [Vitrella brassicaformis CCMP3155]